MAGPQRLNQLSEFLCLLYEGPWALNLPVPTHLLPGSGPHPSGSCWKRPHWEAHSNFCWITFTSPSVPKTWAQLCAGASEWWYLVNVGSGFCWRLHVLDAPRLGLPAGLVHGHLPTLLQVRLVPHQQERDLVLFCLHPQDLLPVSTNDYLVFLRTFSQIQRDNQLAASQKQRLLQVD